MEINLNQMNSNYKNKPFLKVSETHSNNFIDENGEITREVKELTYLTNDKDKFYLQYAKLVAIFAEYNGNLSDIKVFHYILKNSVPGSIYAINKSIREDIKKTTGLSTSAIEKSLSSLILPIKDSHPLILYIGRGTYMVNPEYVFQGSTQDRAKALKISLELYPESFNGKSNE